jgi:regulator of protease activity HflC (stomatin/prohibitin superfamily)
MSSVVATILLVVLVIAVIAAVVKSVRIVPQASAGIVERFGRYHRTLNAGLNIVTPFIDRLRPLIDLREQVVSFPPQPVITMDNLVVGIDTVIYFQVTDPRAATYEVANYITAVEQLTVTTLRNVVGGMELEHALTSRDQINSELRKELDEATGKWGIRVSRVELKAIEPPGSIQESMQKQMRADRDKRAAILSAEGSKQSAILTAEGERQAAVLKARGESEAALLRAEAEAKAQAVRARGQAEAISTVFRAIHDGNPDQRLLAYQYMQMLPQLAQGDANKVWIVPSEIGKALEGIGGFFSGAATRFAPPPEPAQAPAPDGAAPVVPAPAAPGLSGPGSQLDTSVAGDSSLEGWLAGGSGTVNDAAVGDGEGGSVPGAGDAGGAPLHHDPALMQGPTEMGAPI